MTDIDSQLQQRAASGQTEEKFLNAFFVLYKTARIVDPGNDTFRNQLRNFMNALHAVAGERPTVVIKDLDGHHFVNERLVRFDDRGLSGAAEILEQWRKIGLGGVRIDAEIPDVEAGRFFQTLAAIRPDEHNLEFAIAQLKTLGIEQIELLSTEQVKEDEPKLTDDERRQLRQMARTVFFRAMDNVRQIVAGVRHGQELNVVKTKRVVHSLIDHIVHDEHSLLELTAIRDYDDYTFAHSTNVAVYALTMGVRLNLDRARLSQLGFAALFHDVGKIKLPQDLVRKPEAFDEDDWLQMQRHPLLGVKTILRNLKVDVHTARAARAAFEHHINTDFTGYPMLHYDRRPANLFSGIVAIVDTFDAMTSGRVYMKKQFTADVVLKKMRYQMQSKFDAFLLKIFNDIIGVYPAGSLVLLTTDEVALILTNNESEPLRPYIKIVGNREGLLDDPLWVDLSLPEHYKRKIVRMVEPERYGLSIRDFILDR
jgi:HD-GYP domain-containing protein (c-di-GMP phosphodiesterase class II)